jgi:hypothetical protein
MLLAFFEHMIYNRYFPMAKIIVQNTDITVLSQDDKDYISLTDMANGKQNLIVSGVCIRKATYNYSASRGRF